ncbi:porin [Shewanella frigidimarina]|uniref:porin n=1 Tax=Shewanella frigidimarina TaxID=56812 RepID=UPI003D7A2D42
MFTRCTVTCLFLVFCAGSFAADINQEQTTDIQQAKGNVNQSVKDNCKSSPNLTACKEKIEHIEVVGRYVGIEVPEVVGRAHLNRQFIESTPKTNGDINELIALLPGVQLNENASSIDNLAEISAPEITISGAKPWQTGFSIDGMNYNNRIDPASSSRINSSSNDVSGGVQSMNINSQIVSSITVYDHNIPAEYGDFSGGVVDVETISPFISDGKVSVGYRGNKTSWGQYNYISPQATQSSEDVSDTNYEAPIYEKNSVDLMLQGSINQHHALMFNMNYLESTISDISLANTKQQQRRNANALLKYGYRDGWVDKLDISLLYSPYEEDSFLKDVLDSDYHLEGGSVGGIISVSQDTDIGLWQSNINLSQSSNSRTGPEHYYLWLQAKGKEWGQNSIQSKDAVQVSKQGGYGSLDNTQSSYQWRNSLSLPTMNWYDSEHHIKTGVELNRQQISRDRAQDSYFYDSPIQYSTDNSTTLNCSGYSTSCIEQSFIVDLDTLAEQLGGTIDFTQPEHIQAYSNNVLTTPQYFQSRQVTPAEYIDVNLNKAAFYITDNMRWAQLQLNLGLRYDYDDFFENHNFSPRFSMGYDIFDDGDSLITFGLNRYYDAGLLNYKIKEQQRFAYTEYRPIRNGYLQGWLPSSYTGNYRYKYDNLATPFDDEVAIGFKQATDYFGNFSIKYVKRKKHQQLARNSNITTANDGYQYITMNNSGDGHSDRISISWDARFADHSFWANASYSKNYESNSDYNAVATQTPVEELVFYNDSIISIDELDTIRSNFGRPVTANFGWSTDWNNNLSTSITGTYSAAYDTAQLSGNLHSTNELTWTCPECESNSILLPVYNQVTMKERVMLALNVRWKMQLSENQQLQIRADVSNLFNSRTYTVAQDSEGIEPGRMLWLGVTYTYE